MRAVLIAVTGLLAISVRAQESCVTPEYTTDIVPVCLPNQRIKLPSYADPTSYYSCTTGKPVLTKCQAPTGYFSYVLQECTSCANYIPAVACEENKLGLKCEPISESGVTTAAPPGNSTAAPTTVTTAAPGDSTTAAPTTVTTKDPTTAASTTANPDSTLTTGASTTVDGNEPSGTTISIPNPPSPNDPNVPAPPTPEPTAGTIVPGPPTVAT